MQTILNELPAGLKERRLTNRVQKTWRSCAESSLPSWEEVQRLDLGCDWRFCFAVDLALSSDFPYFIYMGDGLTRLSDLHLSDASHWEISPLDMAAAKMDEAALSRAPVCYSDILRIPEGRRVVFRSVLLPLSDNGEDVTHVFGAVNGKGV